MGDFDWTADLGMFDDLAFAESMHEVPNFDYSPSPWFGAKQQPSRLEEGWRIGFEGQGAVIV